MTRTGDQAPPAVTLDPDHQQRPWQLWRLVVALERLDQDAYTWDDADDAVVWAGPGPVLAEPFNTPWSGGTSIAGRTGTAMRMSGSTTAAATIPDGYDTAYTVVGFAYRPSVVGGANRNVLQLRDASGTNHLTLRHYLADNTLNVAVGGIGGATIPGASAPLSVLTANVWQYVELRARIHDTAGYVQLRVNGVQVAAASNVDTRNGTGTTINTIALAGHGTATTADYDDLVWQNEPDDTFLGDVTVPLPDDTPYVWDAPQVGSGYTDVYCDYAGLAIAHGEPDENELYATSRCELTLYDPDGRYRNRTLDGRLTYYAPGKGLAVWVVDDQGAKWWLFRGRIMEWHDPMSADHLLRIVAYSGMAELAQDPGQDWSPGAAGQYPTERIQAILTAAGYTRPYRHDAGDITIGLPAASNTSALDLCRQAAWSDGGIVYSDADDSLWFRDRRWRNGRGDQTRVWTITDNACSEAVSDGAVEVWDFAATDADDWLAGLVVLQNVAKLVATAQAAPGTEGALSTALRYTHPGEDLWTTQGAGDALAAHVLAQRSVPRLAVANASILLHDLRQNLWPMLDTRIGDRLRFQHGDTNPDGTLTLMDLTAIVQTLRHDITPEAWTMQLETSPAVSYQTFELWDQTAFTWDDDNAQNVWR